MALNSTGDEAAISAIPDAGSVYEYSRPSSGWATTSSFDAALNEPQGGNLGFSLAIDANDVVAGALTASAPNSKQGAAFVFGEGQPFSISRGLRRKRLESRSIRLNYHHGFTKWRIHRHRDTFLLPGCRRE